jgi:juvenile hormone acid methyltransferase
MNKADIYMRNNPMQMKDSRDVIQEFKDSLNWGRGEIVLDIGCGPGNVTENILKPVLPEDAKIVS